MVAVCVLVLQSDKTEKGTLFWVLDHTHTPFGRRCLVRWVLYPLKDIRSGRAAEESARPSLMCVCLSAGRSGRDSWR